MSNPQIESQSLLTVNIISVPRFTVGSVLVGREVHLYSLQGQGLLPSTHWATEVSLDPWIWPAEEGREMECGGVCRRVWRPGLGVWPWLSSTFHSPENS